jgi:hypothetical protein
MSKVETFHKNNEKFEKKVNEFKETQEELLERKKQVALEKVKVAESIDTPDEFKEVLSELYMKEDELIKEGEKLANGKGAELMNEITDNLNEVKVNQEKVEQFSDNQFEFIKAKAREVSSELSDIEQDANEMLTELYNQMKKATHKWGGEDN